MNSVLDVISATEETVEQGQGGWPCQLRRRGCTRVVGVHRMEKMSRDLEEVRALVMQLAEGKAFLAEGKACAEALRPDHTLCVEGILRKPVCLARSGQGGPVIADERIGVAVWTLLRTSPAKH